MTQKQRWPAGAERYRQDAVDASATARELLSKARRVIRDSQMETRRNPDLKAMMDMEAASLIADAATMIADIQRWLDVAKHGQ